MRPSKWTGNSINRILYHIAWTILPIAGSREPSLGFISLTQLLLKTTVHPKLSHRIYILRLQNMCFCFCTEINYRSGAPERWRSVKALESPSGMVLHLQAQEFPKRSY
ncbi:uncharacterized protein LOC107054107 [Gallus gallus]|uniref:uncharacterized protein LOC107054107 n=1 Tax=Gallus gallus TaxID=9031 RepID=UPI0000448B13|nr:uncharacterized protein LOC107054107 [Gallus gallus]